MLVMEFFSIKMDLAIAAGDIKPIIRGKEHIVSHLLFTDDMLVFTKGYVASLRNIDRVLDLLAQNTGLEINKMKKQDVFQQRLPKSKWT